MFQPTTTDIATPSPDDKDTKGHRLQVNHTRAFEQTAVKTLTTRFYCQILAYIQRLDDPLIRNFESLQLLECEGAS